MQTYFTLRLGRPLTLLSLILLPALLMAAAPALLVKDIYSGFHDGNPQMFTAVGSTVFFVANDGTHGYELWKSDGSSTGTVMVKDINPDNFLGAEIHNLTAVGGTLFFVANDGVNGWELWKSDGTSAGTFMLKDIRPGPDDSAPERLAAMGGALYFTADDGLNNGLLWRSDGTEAGTAMVTGVRPASKLVAAGEALYFAAGDAHGSELWKSNGTSAGTAMVKDINPGSGSSDITGLTAVGAEVYFFADQGGGVLNLWKSDGTAGGTFLVKDINAIVPGYAPLFPTAVGGLLYFFINDGSADWHLWRSDGTGAGTVLVKTINGGDSGDIPRELTAVGSLLFFTAEDGVHGVELWRSDGTTAGTFLVKDINTKKYPQDPRYLTALGSILYFSAQTDAYGAELWRSDGTTAGTVMAVDVVQGSIGSDPLFLTTVGSRLFFAGYAGSSFGIELCMYGPAVVVPPAVTLELFPTPSATTVTLKGTVNPGGAATAAMFEYGETTAYGYTAAVSPGSGTTAQPVSVNIAGLQPLTQYHFRLTASNAGGSVSSMDGTFSTSDMVDSTPPTVTITAPASGAMISDSAPLTLSGSATDNLSMLKVQYSLNGGAFVDAGTQPGATVKTLTYSATLNPVPGPNTVAVKAIDFRNNESAPVTRTFTSVRLRPLTVSVSGIGTVTKPFPGTDNTKKVGLSYTLVATPGAGQVFDRWSMVTSPAGTGITPERLLLPSLTFIHQEGLALAAVFVPSPYTPQVVGKYNGLIRPGPVVTSDAQGFLTAAVLANGLFTGTLKMGDLSQPLTGRFDSRGVARFGMAMDPWLLILRAGKPTLEVKLQLAFAGDASAVSGTIRRLFRNQADSLAAVEAPRAFYNAGNKVPPSLAGTAGMSYTLVLKHRATQASTLDPQYFPQGDGYATGTVKPDGSVSFAGKLADHTAVSFSALLAKDNTWPLYASLYNVKGSIAAWMSLDDGPADTDMTGTALWFRPIMAAQQWYPWGWDEGVEVAVIGSKYAKPPGSVFPGLGAVDAINGNATLTFADGLLSTPVSKGMNISPANAATKAPATDSSFTFVLTPATGLISGLFTHGNGTKPAYQGVLFQKGTNKGGWGYFMTASPKIPDGTGESGGVKLLAR